jgi:hypothetical protein
MLLAPARDGTDPDAAQARRRSIQPGLRGARLASAVTSGTERGWGEYEARTSALEERILSRIAGRGAVDARRPVV